MKQVVLIGHKQRQGKDTFAQFLAEETGGEILHFAEPMKQIIATTFDVSLPELEEWKNEGRTLLHPDGQDQTYRSVLQRFGTEAMKAQFGADVWGQVALTQVLASASNVIIFPDFRYLSEYHTLLQRTDLQITTVNVVRGGGASTGAHSSETELDEFEYQITVDNRGGLAELRESATEVLNMMEGWA